MAPGAIECSVSGTWSPSGFDLGVLEGFRACIAPLQTDQARRSLRQVVAIARPGRPTERELAFMRGSQLVIVRFRRLRTQQICPVRRRHRVWNGLRAATGSSSRAMTTSGRSRVDGSDQINLTGAPDRPGQLASSESNPSWAPGRPRRSRSSFTVTTRQGPASHADSSGIECCPDRSMPTVLATPRACQRGRTPRGHPTAPTSCRLHCNGLHSE